MKKNVKKYSKQMLTLYKSHLFGKNNEQIHHEEG